MRARKIVIVPLLIAAALGLWFAWRSEENATVSGTFVQYSASGQAAQVPSDRAASLPGGAAPATYPGQITADPRPPSAAAPGPASAARPRAALLAAASPGAAKAAAKGGDPLVDLNRVRHMITDYHTLMGENPVGTNAEIMRALMGGNAHQATLVPEDAGTFNDKGELVDRWGTPYFFHQLSRDDMEVHSAGPDKIMGTADDIVIR